MVLMIVTRPVSRCVLQPKMIGSLTGGGKHAKTVRGSSVDGGYFGRPDRATEDQPEGGRHGARFHPARDQWTEGHALGLPRQENGGAGILSRRFHRWLNEGNAGVPGWYRQI